ncbi:unnamed protein product [Eruca vesicaria subsp. sativa]|uniref:Uncharacterized protein n=1 Tax=Eruca vesicaria subsp. sativa TaxID=29727 RepID=A0ABC8L8C9_ERUVS|nr:unnamed protein product [Eruca vesicaria subsp. sativa]
MFFINLGNILTKDKTRLSLRARHLCSDLFHGNRLQRDEEIADGDGENIGARDGVTAVEEETEFGGGGCWGGDLFGGDGVDDDDDTNPLSSSLHFMGKNTMMKRSVEIHAKNTGNTGILNLILLFQGNVGLIFTKGDFKEVSEEFAKYKVGAPTRVGLVAPIDVVVQPGHTGLDTSQTSFFQEPVKTRDARVNGALRRSKLLATVYVLKG